MVELLLNARWQAGLSAARTAISVHWMVYSIQIVVRDVVVAMVVCHQRAFLIKSLSCSLGSHKEFV